MRRKEPGPPSLHTWLWFSILSNIFLAQHGHGGVVFFYCQGQCIGRGACIELGKTLSPLPRKALQKVG